MNPIKHAALRAVEWTCERFGRHPRLGRPRAPIETVAPMNLYLRADGCDWEDGTKEKPLRTLREASMRIPALVSHHVRVNGWPRTE